MGRGGGGGFQTGALPPSARCFRRGLARAAGLGAASFRGRAVLAPLVWRQPKKGDRVLYYYYFFNILFLGSNPELARLAGDPVVLGLLVHCCGKGKLPFETCLL